ncbi:MAG: SDR family NAD(P)-dependent oxidoreductase [Halieaceae bacterium]
MEQLRIIIIGATSSIAKHCARHWVCKASNMLLVGRDEERLAITAEDLRARGPQADIRTITVDFLDGDGIDSLVANYSSDGAIDIALVAHGHLPDQVAAQSTLTDCKNALMVNGVSPAIFMEALSKHMEPAGKGSLAIIGSVAGDRGRKSNYIYGSSKSLVDRYAQGLQHRLAGSGVHVCLIKPGPTLTAMTSHLLGTGMKLAPVEDVAISIVRAIEERKAVIYTPGKWRLIMLIIKHLPRFIFNKLDI